MRQIHHVGSASFALLLLFGAAAESQVREYTIERSFAKDLSYHYYVSLPAGYHDNPEQVWPMILFLHGGGTPDEARLKHMIAPLTALPAIVVAPICPPSPDGWMYANWHWRMLGDLTREVLATYRVDPAQRAVTGFSMGGSGAWELPFHEPDLFTRVGVIAGVCHPWSLRHFPKIPVWVFVGAQDYMQKEQRETVSSARRFDVDVVETIVAGADHGGIYRYAREYDPLLQWLAGKGERVSGTLGE